MSPTLTFDIETIPDVAGIRKLKNTDDKVSDAAVAAMAFKERLEKTGSEFLPLHLHRVVAISCVLRSNEGIRVWSLGGVDDTEAALVQRFFDGIEKFTPQIISWNGGGFDLPVLHYRGLLSGVNAQRYWDMGEDDRDFKWNNYIGRYHARHLDLMDLLARFQPRANAPLDEISQLLGFPGKVGMSGGHVWEKYQNGGLVDIRNYCETDVVNTYLVYVRFQLMRGEITTDVYEEEINYVKNHIQSLPGEHWIQFLQAWT
jgi:predicted PolB exonuclease-like 3'-5' exonuclease